MAMIFPVIQPASEFQVTWSPILNCGLLFTMNSSAAFSIFVWYISSQVLLHADFGAFRILGDVACFFQATQEHKKIHHASERRPGFEMRNRLFITDDRGVATEPAQETFSSPPRRRRGRSRADPKLAGAHILRTSARFPESIVSVP